METLIKALAMTVLVALGYVLCCAVGVALLALLVIVFG